MGTSKSFILTVIVLIFGVVAVCSGKPPTPEDIGTNFFLKASKSVPRIGRRTMDYENYFLKASKSIPRIGRRTLYENENGWFPRDTQEAAKRSFFEKFFKENEPPVWNDLEKLYQDYPAAFVPEETFPENGIHPKPDPYYPRTKKGVEIIEDQHQTQNK